MQKASEVEGDYEILTKASIKSSKRDYLNISSVSSSRVTPFGYNIEKPVSLVTLDLKENVFRLSQSAEEYLSSLVGEIYVISVSGNPLVGKSSSLNLLLSLFSHHNVDTSQLSTSLIPYRDIYSVGDGKKSTTDGVDMFCVTIAEKNYIFMDVEGDNDPNKKKTGVWIYTNLISTALAVSHVHIYNYTGLPQESYFAYFESINKQVQNSKLHPNFNTEHIFLKKDHEFEADEDAAAEVEEFKSYFDTKLSKNGIKSSLYLLESPPLHIQKKNSKDSCLKGTGFICEKCQESPFFQTFTKVFNEIISSSEKVPSFKDSQELISLLRRVLEINTKELPFSIDMGHIAKIRSMKFKKDDDRIKKGLMEIEKYPIDKTLSKQIQKIFHDHPMLSQETEWVQNFDEVFQRISIQISQMEFLIPELSKFVEDSLLENGYSILNATEKGVLLETYLNPFKRLTNEIVRCLKTYDEILGGLIEKLTTIQEQIGEDLKTYNNATFDARARTVAVSANFLSSSCLVFLAQEFAIKAIAGCLVGGGVVGGILTVVMFIQAKRKWDEAKKKNAQILNAGRIPGVGNVNVKEAVEEMTKLQTFIKEKLKDLEGSYKVLQEVSQEEAKDNQRLVEKIEEIIDKKINGEKLSEDDRSQLIDFMKGAQSNFEKFKQCI